MKRKKKMEKKRAKGGEYRRAREREKSKVDRGKEVFLLGEEKEKREEGEGERESKSFI